MMRASMLAGGLVLALGLGVAAPAPAYTRYGSGPGGDITSDSPGVGPGQGIGAWRRHYDRQQYRRYRGNPGAQYELRQKRRNLCRNVPEMC